jgi:hypothetical protein
LIDVIVVYKVDRLTRSLADFAKMVEVFDAQGVSFVELRKTEKRSFRRFNSTGAMAYVVTSVLAGSYLRSGSIVVNSAYIVPRLLSKIDEALRLPHLSDLLAIEVKAIAERIEALFLSIRDTADERHYERLTATVDRLHQEIAHGEAALDRLLKSNEQN